MDKINTVKGITFTLGVMALIGAIVFYLVPNTSQKRILKIPFLLIVIICIITPLNYIKTDIYIPDIEIENYSFTESFNEQLKKITVNQLASVYKPILVEEGLELIAIDAEIVTEKSFQYSIKKVNIIAKGKHKNISTVEELLKEQMGIPVTIKKE